jgi:hypothetical protein
MKNAIILYHPKGGKDGVTPHPSKIEEMKAKGWAEKSETKSKSKTIVKEQDNGKS